MNQEKVEKLFKNHIAGKLTPEEESILFKEIQNLPDELILEWIDKYINPNLVFSFPQSDLYNKVKQRSINESESAPEIKGKVLKWQTITLVASLLIILTLGYYTLQIIPNESAPFFVESAVVHTNEYNEIILPNSASAKLSFSNGQEIVIEDSMAASISLNGLEIRNAGNDLVELGWSEGPPVNQSYSFTTPKGSSYQVKLQDGSLIWLNSGSTIRLEPGFNRKGRKVHLEGEAYFQVAKNRKLPFLVAAQETVVEVLGTQFNVKAYPNEGLVQTTLEEGSVDLQWKGEIVRLIPGQQASCQSDQSKVQIRKVDLTTIMSWKDGYFRFDNQGIQEIMNSLKNWYSINEIDYQYQTNEKFTGSLARTNKLSDVLHGLEMISDIKFKIEEGRVVVTK